MKNSRIYIIITAIAALFALPLLVYAATPKVDKLTVIDISTSQKPAYVIYWKSGKGKVTLTRGEAGKNFTPVVETEANMYIDYGVKAGTTYDYRLGEETAVVSDQLGGKPAISDIRIEPGVVTKDTASVVVTFKTDKLAQSQLFYGESIAYTSQTEIDQNLNQSHTVVVEKLKPGSSYHFKVKAIEKTGKESTESADTTFTMPPPGKEISIFEIIIQALGNAFNGFEKWLHPGGGQASSE